MGRALSREKRAVPAAVLEDTNEKRGMSSQTHVETKKKNREQGKSCEMVGGETRTSNAGQYARVCRSLCAAREACPLLRVCACERAMVPGKLKRRGKGEEERRLSIAALPHPSFSSLSAGTSL